MPWEKSWLILLIWILIYCQSMVMYRLPSNLTTDTHALNQNRCQLALLLYVTKNVGVGVKNPSF
jgi:hypothetical protein